MKWIGLALLSLALGCGGTAVRSAPVDWPPARDDVARDPAAAAAVSFATAQVGRPYCWGGTGPSCFDCSGLVQAAWRAGGVKLPRTSDAQGHVLAEVPLDSIRAGDVLWWPGHVALYVGDGAVVEAVGQRVGIVRRRAKLPARALRITSADRATVSASR
jgi:cell wall-associated NlpC family hydrolase